MAVVNGQRYAYRGRYDQCLDYAAKVNDVIDRFNAAS